MCIYMCVFVYYPSLEHHFPKMSNTMLQWEELHFSWTRDERHWFLYSTERQSGRETDRQRCVILMRK